MRSWRWHIGSKANGTKRASHWLRETHWRLASRQTGALGDLGESWVAWLMARISLDEATTLINNGSTVDGNLSRSK